VAVGGVRPGYALRADRVRVLADARRYRAVNVAAGAVMVAVGVYLIIRT
jgi:threonine/homoserine/homoserine lactone efflux protein